MNERIRELAQQAGLYVNVNGKPWPRNMNGEDIEGAYKKFADLLIQECIEQGTTLANHYINTHNEHEQVLLLASIADFSNQLKHYFGVEL